MTGTLDGYIEKRTALLASAEPGTVAARMLSDLTDEAVSALAGAASARAGAAPFAVLATGGYGAQRLLPCSDLDLLIITEAPLGESQVVVRELIYPLWDAGLAASHQVRRPRDQARAVAEDLETLTAFLTARYVAGDQALAEQTVTAVFGKLRGRAVPRMLRQIAQRERPGSPYLLEPDLKESAGGQRDIDELVWREALLAGAPMHAYERLADAQDAITAARWRLHLCSGRGGNVMALEAAYDAGIDAACVQQALAEVDPALLEARGVAEPPVPDDLRELSALAAGPDGVASLERLAYSGALDALVPGFSPMMTLRRPALSHRYTVGAHSIRTLAATVAAKGFASLADAQRDALALAALVHDIGKREEGPGHSTRGAEGVAAVAWHLGLHEDIVAPATALVREHLLLSEVAQSRDLSDEDVVLAAAARLGDRALVRPLLLLTAADMQATGPDVWTPWRSTLVTELADKLEAALAPDVDGAGIVAAGELTRTEALRHASSVGAPRSVLAFLERAPLRYLARRSAGQALRDARLVQELAGPGLIGEVAFGVRPGPLAGTWHVDVVTRDRPGLFATISGCLALAGLDALAAEAYTEASGIALDTFTVTSATLAPLSPATWAAFERALHASLRDPSGLDTRLAERRRHYPQRAGSRFRTRITFGHHGPFTTGVRVRTADRVGLLHDLARAFERAELDIRRAVVTTAAGVADDTFEVTDAHGAPVPPEEISGRLAPLVRTAAGQQ
ncbi:MAG: [protein-PII] uridylyltransferase family protein [Coriobacteriia bacterium]